MASGLENAVMLPPHAEGSEEIRDVLRQLDRDLESGGSTVLFGAGRAASANTKQLTTVVVVVIGLEDEARENVYQYLFAIQAITHRLRPVIFTDGSDLRAIRRYGWMTEHVMARESYESLSNSPRWGAWVADRIRASQVRFDAGRVLVCGADGVSAEQHDQLMLRMRQNVPFAATRM